MVSVVTVDTFDKLFGDVPWITTPPNTPVYINEGSTYVYGQPYSDDIFRRFLGTWTLVQNESTAPWFGNQYFFFNTSPQNSSTGGFLKESKIKVASSAAFKWGETTYNANWDEWFTYGTGVTGYHNIASDECQFLATHWTRTAWNKSSIWALWSVIESVDLTNLSGQKAIVNINEGHPVPHY